MKFIIIRHGEREDHIDPTWIATAENPSDPPLSKVGLEQARLVGEHLKKTENVDAIFASPFTRTLQTATGIADVLDLPLQVESGLAEWLNPDFRHGKPMYWPSLEDSMAAFPRIESRHSPLLVPEYPEDNEAVCARVADFVRLFIPHLGITPSMQAADVNRTIALVSHGKIVEELCISFTGVDSIPYVTYCSNTHVVQVPDAQTPTFKLGKSVCDVSFIREDVRPTDPNKVGSASYA
jgi:broad specificity phosphatase PhoE